MQAKPLSGRRVAYGDNSHDGMRHRMNNEPRMYVRLIHHPPATIIEKILSHEASYGTLGRSRVLENKRLPQKARLFKLLEGGYHSTITQLEQIQPKSHQEC